MAREIGRARRVRAASCVVRVVAVRPAFVGVFSYSLYLTHELVIMQSWWFVSRETSADTECAADRDTGHGRVCLGVLSVLREALHEEDGATEPRDRNRTRRSHVRSFRSSHSNR